MLEQENYHYMKIEGLRMCYTFKNQKSTFEIKLSENTKHEMHAVFQ